MSYIPTFEINNLGIATEPTVAAVKTNTRTSTATAFDHEGVLITGLAGEIMLDGGRRVETLSSTLTTHGVTVEVGRTYQVSCEGANASTVILSGAATGTLTNNGADRQAFDTAKTATTTTLTLTISGTLTHVQVEDVTGSSNDAPSAKIDASTDYGYGVDGVQWHDTENGNSVSGNVVTEAAGGAISPAPQVQLLPARTNAVINNCFSEIASSTNFDDWTETIAGSSTLTQETSDLPPGFTTGVRFDVDSSTSNASLTQTKRLSIGAGGIATMSSMFKIGSASGLKFSVIADDGVGGSIEYLSANGSAWQAGSVFFAPSDLPTVWAHWEHTLPATNAGRTHVRIAAVTRAFIASLTHRMTALQLEDGLKATPPIQTTTVAVTRDND